MKRLGRSNGKVRMGLWSLVGLVGLTASLLFTGLVYAGGESGSLQITSPRQDEVIKGGEVTVEWVLELALEVYHVHIKVDEGRPMVTKSNSKTFKGFKPGKHTIAIWIVDADHQRIGLEESVVFIVE